MIAAEKQRNTWLLNNDEDEDMPDAGSLVKNLAKEKYGDDKVRTLSGWTLPRIFTQQFTSFFVFFLWAAQGGDFLYLYAVWNPCIYYSKRFPG